MLGAINVDAIAVGGFSRGAATATATVSGLLATTSDEFDIPPDSRAKALVLIDGTPNTNDWLTTERLDTVRVPTLSIGGSVGSFLSNRSLLPVASPMYGVDAINAAHGDFISSCRFLNSLLESNAPQEVLDFFGVHGPIECGPDLFPRGEEVEIVARHTTAFLDSQLGNDRTNDDVLKPSRQDLAGRITLSASVVGAGPASEWADLSLTDPSRRQIGVDPQTGESFSDFSTQEIQYLAGQSPTGFSIHPDAVLAGDYLLTANGNASISQPRTLRVTLELLEQRQHSLVFEREVLLSEPIDAGISIDPLRFEIVPAVLQSGDFNQDGAVDAADYVVWRKSLGQSGPGLSADGNDNNFIDPGDYEVWRATSGTQPAGAMRYPPPSRCRLCPSQLASCFADWSSRRGPLPGARPYNVGPEPSQTTLLFGCSLVFVFQRTISAGYT